jgi:hypothetical protein
MEDLESRQLVLQLRLVSAAIRALPSQEALQQVLEEERQAHRRLKAEHNLLLAFLRSVWVNLLVLGSRQVCEEQLQDEVSTAPLANSIRHCSFALGTLQVKSC